MKKYFIYILIPAILFFCSVKATAQSCTSIETFAGDDKEICKGDNVAIGCAQLSNYCYKWEPEIGLDNPISPTPIAFPNSTTTYILHVTDDNGNYLGTDQVTVFVNQISVNLGADVMICAETPTNLSVSIIGVPLYSIQWSTGEETESIIVAPTEESTYSVTVTDNTGCVAIDNKKLSISNDFEVTFIPEEPIFCSSNGVPLQIQAIPNISTYSYSWSNGANTPTIAVISAGNYFVTITDENNCQSKGEVEVKDYFDPQVIKQKLIEKGFFSTEVMITELPGRPARSMNACPTLSIVEDYTEGLLQIEFVQNGSMVEMACEIENYLTFATANFFNGVSQTGFVTSNEDFCDDPNLFESLCNTMMSSQIGYWAHIWRESENDENGILFAICRTPEAEGFSPISTDHSTFITTLLGDAPSLPLFGHESESNRQAFMILDNLLYNVTEKDFTVDDEGEFTPGSNVCSPVPFFEAIAVAPTAIPMKLKLGAILRFGPAAAPVGTLMDKRSLIGFTQDGVIYTGRYRRYFNSPGSQSDDAFDFSGYYNKYGGDVPYLYSDPILDEDFTHYNVMLGKSNQLPCPEKAYFIVNSSYKTEQPFFYNQTGEGGFIVDFSNSATITTQYVCNSVFICPPEFFAGDFFLGFHTDPAHEKNNPDDGEYGWVFHVKDINGNIQQIHAMYTFSSPNEPLYHIYNTATGVWEIFEPPAQSLYDDFCKMIKAISDAGHLLLDVAGFVPVAGEIFDVINGIWYIAEGESGEGALSLCSVIPFSDIGIKSGKYFVKAQGFYEVTKITKKYNDEAHEYVFAGINDKLTELYPDINAAKEKGPKLYNWLFNEADDLVDINGVSIDIRRAFVDNPDLVKSWKLIEEVHPGLGNNRPKDFHLISKVNELLSDQNFMTKISGTGNPADGPAALKVFINKFNGPCKKCDPPGAGVSHYKNIDEYLNDLSNYVNVYSHVPGFGTLLSYAKRNSQNFVDAAAHQARYLKENASSVTHFEPTMADFTDEALSDVVVKTIGDIREILPSGGGFRHIELKSWGDSKISGISTNADFINQFTGYLSIADVNNLSNLKYSFDVRKLSKTVNSNAPYNTIGEAELIVKQNFKDMIYYNSTAIYISKPVLFNNFTVPSTGLPIESAQDFTAFINEIDITHSFFNFIKVE